uniref:Small ribosomal subunit protein uS7c n=1 Tax=Phacus pleuronectes TaxID=102908 RepID=A0A3G3LLV9_9EUGL|nr:ribosomal protein S7 [Phacus pleuronectes]AYQ93690.1 ribosomal protein S7 [Phacus pleuronectes]
MSRRKTAKKRIILPDAIYNSKLVSMIINKIMCKGKKTLAEHIFYESMKKVHETTNKDALEVLEKAIENITPNVELKSRRIGGATYQVPTEIKSERGISLALSFLTKSAKKRPGRTMISKLGNELIDAYNNCGNSIKKKDELNKMALANKAFANFKF